MVAKKSSIARRGFSR